MVQKTAALIITAVLTGHAYATGFMPWTEVMAMADANKDGALTMEEVMHFESNGRFVGFMPFMVDHFKDCDANGDAMLNAEELGRCTKAMGMTEAQTAEVFYKGLGFMPRAQQ